jgi:hypothetical protein
MKIEDLKEVNILTQYINGIEEFIDRRNNNSKSIEIGTGTFILGINKEYEHEIIDSLKRIKSNMVERLKELGVEV